MFKHSGYFVSQNLASYVCTSSPPTFFYCTSCFFLHSTFTPLSHDFTQSIQSPPSSASLCFSHPSRLALYTRLPWRRYNRIMHIAHPLDDLRHRHIRDVPRLKIVFIQQLRVCEEVPSGPCARAISAVVLQACVCGAARPTVSSTAVYCT